SECALRIVPHPGWDGTRRRALKTPSAVNAVLPKPRLTPGRLVYLCYHRPKALLAQSRREGGPWQQWLTARGRAAMIAAAARLPVRPLRGASDEPGTPEIAFLSGERFWYQTAFCLWSLVEHADGPLRVAIYDDGSFNPALAAEARRLFPGI